MPPKPRDPSVRFDALHTMGDGCWEWQGSRKPNGYGEFVVRTRVKVYAHRFAYARAFGAIPEGMEVCHTCDNRSCVRPEHLVAGTRSDNMRDASAKGRIVNHVGPAPANANLHPLESRRDAA